MITEEAKKYWRSGGLIATRRLADDYAWYKPRNTRALAGWGGYGA